MGFSEKQTQALRRKLDTRHVSTREANGRELSYIEGWYAISEANRIFGFDGWNRETVESRCVLARENRGSLQISAGHSAHLNSGLSGNQAEHVAIDEGQVFDLGVGQNRTDG